MCSTGVILSTIIFGFQETINKLPQKIIRRFFLTVEVSLIIESRLGQCTTTLNFYFHWELSLVHFRSRDKKKYLSYAYNKIDSQKAYASKENKIGFFVTSNIIRLRSLLKSYRKMIAHQIIQYTNLSETKMIKNLSILKND